MGYARAPVRPKMWQGWAARRGRQFRTEPHRLELGRLLCLRRSCRQDQTLDRMPNCNCLGVVPCAGDVTLPTPLAIEVALVLIASVDGMSSGVISVALVIFCTKIAEGKQSADSN